MENREQILNSQFSIHNSSKPRVALVCDWLLGTGGAERVVLELHKMFPQAPIYTSQYNPDPKIWYGDKWFKDADIRTGWLQKLPTSLKKFLPVLRAWYFSRLDLSEYDLVISSSGAEAKYVKVGRIRPSVLSPKSTVHSQIKNIDDSRLTTDDSNMKRSLHICYCHAPTHYYWARYEEYLKEPGFGMLDPLARAALKLLVGPMRRLDYNAAQRPDHFVANSNFTREQIKKYYGRDARVIHPPVDVERFAANVQPAAERHGYVTAGRQTPYKRIDLAIEAANKLDVPLVVIGNGPEYRRLKWLAGRKITFLTDVSDEQMPGKFASAKAFIFPGVDDFGIVAVEALAIGTPVIAYKEGGQTDYINSQNGIFFSQQSIESLASAIEQLDKKNFDHQKISLSAKQFSAVNFQKKLREFIAKVKKTNISA